MTHIAVSAFVLAFIAVVVWLTTPMGPGGKTLTLFLAGAYFGFAVCSTIISLVWRRIDFVASRSASSWQSR